MSKKNKVESTSSTSVITDENKLTKFKDWLITWWPVVLLFAVLIGAGITKYIYPNEVIYSLMIHLTKAISILMVVIYVIYTRSLALETKKMANASMALFYSEKGTVRSEVKQGNCNYDDLCDTVKDITKEIHLSEKKFTENEFQELMKQKNLPSVYVVINNLSGRRVQLAKIEYIVRHTGSDKKHSKTINVSEDARIDPWEDKEINLIVAPEGEIELEVEAIYYLDNRGIINRIVVDKTILIERIRVPKNIEDES